jgi:protein-S-isoprenylcysteine O-methyltransferase Ste14
MNAARSSGADAGAWRHARAIALLPLTNTVVIPAALLALWPVEPPAGGVALALLAIGSAVATAGVALVAHSISLFMRLGRGTLAPWDPTRALVAAGAYRYHRNPMKAGLFLVLAGEAIATQSAALAAWFAVFLLVNVVYIRLHEEPGLERRFGERYREYCARVPRWWPTLRALRSKTMETTTP